MVLKYLATALQVADMFTKQIFPKHFERLRRVMMGHENFDDMRERHQDAKAAGDNVDDPKLQGTRKQPVFPQRTENKRVFQHRKTNAVFLFCFFSAMVLWAAGASPGAAPCRRPPNPFSPPFNPKSGRGSWREAK